MTDDKQRQIDDLEMRIEKLESLVLQLLPDNIRIPQAEMTASLEYEIFADDWAEYVDDGEYS